MIAALIKSGKILKGRPQKDHRGLGLRLGALESMMMKMIKQCYCNYNIYSAIIKL